MWTLLGIEFHRRWRSGQTWLDCARGNLLVTHYGWFSLEWARGPHVAFFKAMRKWKP